MTKYTLIARLKEIGVVQQRQVQLSHAGSSDVYFDVKKAYGDPWTMQLIIDELWNLMREDMRQQKKEITTIAGTGIGGITPASIMYMDYNKKLTIVRTEKKEHGLEQQIEAHAPTKDDIIAIVDDVGTTGKTVQKATDILQTTGAQIIGAYFVVKRGDVKLTVPARYVMTAEELL